MNLKFLLFLIVLLPACNPDDAVRTEKSENTINSEYDTTDISNSEIPFVNNIKINENDLEKKKPGNEIRVLENGIKLTYHRKGSGEIPVSGDVVQFDFEKKVSGGKVFDASRKTGKPVAVMLGLEIIPDYWQKVIETLHVGDSVTISVPSELAYGQKGLPGLVPPNSDIEIEMNLLRTVKPVKLEQGGSVFRFFENTDSRVKADTGNTVVISYFAFYSNGKMFDASAKNSAPFTFRLGQANMMKGVQDAFSILGKGDWAYIYIPSERGYGKKGLMNMVPPNQDLVYMVEVVDIQP
jgi:FKBP-type peptidyl-prolyl cis-trans isomerase